MFKKIIFSENFWAIILCLLVIGLMIFTADDAPLWIYQGF